MRLFFAIEIGREISTRLIDFQSNIELEGARTIPPANYHITLSFLGDMTEKQLDLILSNLENISLSPFEVELTDLLFLAKPGIVALNVIDPESNLLKLKSGIESQLNQIGIRQFDKHSYLPHLTLYRKVEHPPKQNLNFNAKLKIKRFSLMHSQNGRDGVHYYPIENWQLNHSESIKSRLLGR